MPEVFFFFNYLFIFNFIVEELFMRLFLIGRCEKNQDHVNDIVLKTLKY